MKGFIFICFIWSAVFFTSNAVPFIPETLGQSKACANNYCQNEGLCIPFVDDFYTCDCQPGFSGAFCHKEAEQEGVLDKDIFKKVGLIPEMIDVAPSKIASILYAGDNLLAKNTGKTNTPTQVRYQPLTISWPDTKPDHYYTIIMIDPDMPSRSTPIAKKTQVLHWLMVNIPGSGVGGRQLAPYIGSGPPPGTGIHRYTFLVFDEGTSPKDYTSVKPFDLVKIGRRVNWNFVEEGKPWTLRGFKQWANMGEPIASNFYLAQWDQWVDELWRTFDTFYSTAGSK